MDSPFFGSRRFQSKLPSDQKIRRQVAQIPVQSVGSESKTWSALKIQKKFRGFLVRKSVKRIKAIKIQVDEIEGMLLKSEVVELVRKDARERMRMNEGLMALLLKLDSIPGVDSGVRDCRKAVIRRAIALQERIDAIASVNLVSSGENTDEDEAFKEPVTLEIMNSAEDNSSDGMMDLVENNSVKFEDSEKLDSAEFRNSSVEESLIEKNEQKNDDWVEVECSGKEKVGSRIVTRDENKRNCEVLERMMEDNKKMMRLMTQLFERNEMQTSMLSDLTHRVGQLEKAFTCDRLSRMKKKKKLAASRAE
ncbi:unnamed protein product [Fraxinus pennsylvanica]|uniref:BAG domain-containing protein n=1 Tax=Fraxinus pennsylvanica TaxID=56036 RepID=A0AAD1Z2J9_9LAMI|nr:unnamed protein product [Fraxinus pennsylvanica]